MIALVKRQKALPSLAVAIAVMFPFETGFAKTRSGCAALASEKADMPQGIAAKRSTGAVPLHAGETLRMRVTNSGTSTGTASVVLNEGGEIGPVIVAGTVPLETAFTVPFDGLFGLEFHSDGGAPLQFIVECEAKQASFFPSASPEAFVQRRANSMLSDTTGQTSLRRRAEKPATIDKAVKSSAILDEHGQPRQISVTTSAQQLAAAEGARFVDDKLDVWLEGRIAQFEHSFDDNGQRYTADGNSGALSFGADYLLGPSLMVGALLRLDSYAEEYGAPGTYSDSRGTMFGPYASLRIAPDLVFDAHMAWGASDNMVDGLDGTRLTFESERHLVRGQLTGQRNVLGLQFAPAISVSVVEERAQLPKSLTDGDVPASASVFGRLGASSTLSYRVPLEDGGFLQPSAGLSKGWTLDGFEPVGIHEGSFINETGARAEAGLVLGTAGGVSIEAAGAIEGLGRDDYSAWSGRLSVTAPLN